MNRVDAAGRKGLSKFGAYVRQRARTSIRNRKVPSAPDSPPSSHTGDLRNWILFAYDDSTRSVVIGPAKLNKPGEAPALLEIGGAATRMRHGKSVRAFYRPRPYMQPAFDAELPKAVGYFAEQM